MIECPDCGRVQRAPALAPGEWAACVRCGAALASGRAGGFDTTLALALAAALLLAVAWTLPFLEFAYRGRRTVAHAWTGIELLARTGFEPLAGLVALTLLAAPVFLVGGLIAVTAPLARGACPSWVAGLYRAVLAVRPWAMLEIFLLGALVAVVKLGQLASVEVRGGFWALVAVVPLTLAAFDALSPGRVWRAVDAASGGPAPSPAPAPAPTPSPSRSSASAPGPTAGAPAVGCPVCALRVAWPEAADGVDATARRVRVHCPRCGERLHRRKPFAAQRAVALLLAAAILYVPANVLPVLRLDLMGREQADTILAGVESLIAGGLWEVAALVFFASFLVPGLKILGLGHLVFVLRRPAAGRAVSRTRLYRVVDHVGRWSMIDVFMTAVLVGLVQLGAIARIVPGAGATCFAAVVVLTLFAANSFDPRALWDGLEEADGR